MRWRIELRKIDKPRNNRLQRELRWVCDSLGLVSGRDTESTAFKVLSALLEQCRTHRLVSSDALARKLKMERARINHHLRNLMQAGLLYKEKRKVRLRGGSLAAALEEIKSDVERSFNELIEVSRKIDREFRLS
ncbi:ArsR family transcriptional regulator [Candidatus Pacearchaeota archaeon]|nr:MAG: ArsR family transcriptional regulator [Candidatus Pacearchaeota archaeon]